VLKAMRESVSTKPAIFAMSNPTMNGLFVQGSLCTNNSLIMFICFHWHFFFFHVLWDSWVHCYWCFQACWGKYSVCEWKPFRKCRSW